MGYNPLSVHEGQFTTHSVLRELRPNSTSRTRIQLAIESRKLSIHTPSVSSLKAVEEAAHTIGDISVLSRADKDVLAVAVDLSRTGLSPKLISDDYAVQNVAEFLDLKYVSLTTLGIRYRFKWVLYCPACKRRYTPDIENQVCSICGTQLKRKVLEKKIVRR